MPGEVAPNITLYEAAGQPDGPKGWNPFTTRIRYALNFKGIPFKTVYLSYPSIEPILRKLHASPTGQWPDGRPLYSLPVITDSSYPTEDGKPRVISDSWAIVTYLEDYYETSQSLVPPDTRALQISFKQHVDKYLYMEGLGRIIVHSALSVISDAGQEYFRATRETVFGTRLEDVCPKNSEIWNKSWDNVLKALDNLSMFMDQNGSGKLFVMGDRPSFADFVIVSFLNTASILAPDGYSKISERNRGRWGRLVDSCRAWADCEQGGSLPTEQ